MRDKGLSLVSRWQTVTDLVQDSCVERGFTVDTVNYLFPHSARYVQAKAVALNSRWFQFPTCATFSSFSSSVVSPSTSISYFPSSRLFLLLLSLTPPILFVLQPLKKPRIPLCFSVILHSFAPHNNTSFLFFCCSCFSSCYIPNAAQLLVHCYVLLCGIF